MAVFEEKYEDSGDNTYIATAEATKVVKKLALVGHQGWYDFP